MHDQPRGGGPHGLPLRRPGPGAELTLKFRGQFRDNGNARTHVSASSTTPDPNPDNNRPGGERTNVQENENDGPAKPGQQSDGVAGGPPSCASPFPSRAATCRWTSRMRAPSSRRSRSTSRASSSTSTSGSTSSGTPSTADLEIEIEGPDGTTVTLVDNRGGSARRLHRHGLRRRGQRSNLRRKRAVQRQLPARGGALGL
ncbi:MAG: hypothetical protein WKF31_03620 [Thermoleophilaceae bacterium]